MGYQWISWERSGFHGISEDFSGFHGISKDFSGFHGKYDGIWLHSGNLTVCYGNMVNENTGSRNSPAHIDTFFFRQKGQSEKNDLKNHWGLVTY